MRQRSVNLQQPTTNLQQNYKKNSKLQEPNKF